MVAADSTWAAPVADRNRMAGAEDFGRSNRRWPAATEAAGIDSRGKDQRHGVVACRPMEDRPAEVLGRRPVRSVYQRACHGAKPAVHPLTYLLPMMRIV